MMDIFESAQYTHPNDSAPYNNPCPMASPKRSKPSRSLTDMLNNAHGVPDEALAYLPPLPETPRVPRSSSKAYNLSRMVVDRTLPSNDALSSLPPLPQTPRQGATNIDETPWWMDPASKPQQSRVEPIYPQSSRKPRLQATQPSTPDIGTGLPRSKTLNELALPSHSQAQTPISFRQPSYPTLSTRQSGINPVRSTSGSSAFLGVPLESTDHRKSPTLPSRRPSPSHRPALSPSVSASIMFPNDMEASLLQDATFGGMGGRDSMGSMDDSWELNVESLRPKTFYRSPDKATRGDNNAEEGSSPSKSQSKTPSRPAPSPLKVGSTQRKRSGMTPAQCMNQSTLFPSPSKNMNTDLLASVNALTRVDPPWQPADSSTSNMSGISFLDQTQWDASVRETSTSPTKATTRGGMLAPPMMGHGHSRRIPSASALLSLGAVEEDGPAVTDVITAVDMDKSVGNGERDNAGDVSTLFPVSPMKHRHLLSDEHLLLRERMDMSMMEDPNFTVHMSAPRSRAPAVPMPIPMPKSATMSSFATMGLSPRKAVRDTRTEYPTVDSRSSRASSKVENNSGADQTMDLNEMMAKLRKGSWPSGNEESFADLLNGSMDDMDGALLADESFIPLELRPGLTRSKSLSRIETERRLAKVRASIAARDVLLDSPVKGGVGGRYYSPEKYQHEHRRKAESAEDHERGHAAEKPLRREGRPTHRKSLSTGAQLHPLYSAPMRDTRGVETGREEKDDIAATSMPPPAVPPPSHRRETALAQPQPRSVLPTESTHRRPTATGIVSNRQSLSAGPATNGRARLMRPDMNGTATVGRNTASSRPSILPRPGVGTGAAPSARAIKTSAPPATSALLPRSRPGSTAVGTATVRARAPVGATATVGAGTIGTKPSVARLVETRTRPAIPPARSIATARATVGTAGTNASRTSTAPTPRSGSTSARTFGQDAGGTTNRSVPRSTAGVAGATAGTSTRLSKPPTSTMGPPAIPSKRLPTTSARGGNADGNDATKPTASRARSTPASVVARTATLARQSKMSVDPTATLGARTGTSTLGSAGRGRPAATSSGVVRTTGGATNRTGGVPPEFGGIPQRTRTVGSVTSVASASARAGRVAGVSAGVGASDSLPRTTLVRPTPSGSLPARSRAGGGVGAADHERRTRAEGERAGTGTGTTTMSSGTLKVGLADIRARLDRLQARHTVRGAKV